MMGSVAVFILVILATTQAARLMQYNCSNYNMNIQTTTASGMEDFQVLQYCLIDNYTIMRIDTGQQLDIVCTTQSHLVVTPTDGQTSMLIPKNEPEHFCLSPPYYTRVTTATVVGGIILWSLIAIASGFTVAIFLLFKELRTNFGKLL